MSRIVWVYVPGHAGVTINEEADRLAAAATDTSPLSLYHFDIQLIGQHHAKARMTALLQESSKGIRLLSSDTSYAKSSRSRKKGPDRCWSNQLLTGNISTATLRFRLLTLSVEKRICVPMDASLLTPALQEYVSKAMSLYQPVEIVQKGLLKVKFQDCHNFLCHRSCCFRKLVGIYI